jgi:dihydrofolate reductase
VQYVTDVRACVAQARAAAGDADVLVLGAGAAQALLRAGEPGELELHVVPVRLGRGRRLFDHLPAERIELELTRELNAADADPVHRVPHLRYRVQWPPPTQDAGAS